MIIFNTSNFYDCIDCIDYIGCFSRLQAIATSLYVTKDSVCEVHTERPELHRSLFSWSICAKKSRKSLQIWHQKRNLTNNDPPYDSEKLKMNAFWNNCVDIKACCTKCHPRLATIGIQQSIEEALLKLQGLGTMHGISKSRVPVLHKSTMSRRKLIRCKL